ncbi:hypothetical protein M988_2727 [Hafnia paralvei ATCC 29927]|jgi:hypothetical protein|uniref:hypothetical protein n=1 Tax=Hafnia TaxID=568 RepID=UPI0001F06FF3|nr:hypothetical protein [Hafnia paralvei]EFV42138.1 hypothetical protein HMPREF0864_00467 [Enterobacteriaceae bacterium 9_2_54FAA]MDU1193741.1 protein K [Enterobacteriaceae bacterium]MBU2672008.1 protein K [Hafnia paralvei]MBW2958423.1 protein K [Hafnia paralvei]MCE9881502.1 protein K [Hafnia paralvei]
MIKKTMLAALVPAMLVMGGCDDASKEKAAPVADQSNEQSAATQPNAKKDQETNDVDKKLKAIQDQSTPEKIEQFNKLQDNDTQKFQQAVVLEIKKKLPLLVDEATLMSDVSAENNAFTYKYIVKGIPINVIESHEWQETMKKTITSSYCSDDARVTVFRNLFPEGVIYNYYVSEKLIYTYKALPSVCGK